MHFKPLFIVLASGLIASTAAFADTDSERSSQTYPAQRSQPTITFERMDSDSNGELTRAEADADKNLVNHFSSIAGDNTISKSEYTAWVKTGSSGKATHKETGKVDKGSYGTFEGSDLDTGGPVR